jgi:hypothetical protein
MDGDMMVVEQYVEYAVSLPYPQVPYQWIQPTAGYKYQ